MLLTEPEKVEDQQILFARTQSGTASDHLGVQCTDFRRPEDDHTIDGWTIPALCQQHGIAQHRTRPGLIEPFEDLFPIRRGSIDLSGAGDQPCEFLCDADQRTEYNGLPIRGVELNRLSNLAQIWFQGLANRVHLEVSQTDFDLAHVDLERHRACCDAAQVALGHCLLQTVFVGNALEIPCEAFLVASVRCGSYPEDSCPGELSQHLLIAVRYCVVCLVDDHGTKLAGVVAPHHRLNGSDCDALNVGFRSFDFSGRFVVHAAILVSGLLDQFVAVSQDQHGSGTIMGDCVKNDGFATPGRQYQQLSLPFRPVLIDRLDSFLLVWSQLHQNGSSPETTGVMPLV